jgi:hypothetical protein
MKRQLSLVLAITATLALAACQKQEAAAPAADTAAPAESAPAAEPAPADDMAAASTAMAADATAMAPADAAAPAATGESIGIAECDDYLTKYEACVSGHVPAAAQGALKQSLDQTRAGWKQAIAAGGKDQLAAACKTMTEQARTSMKAYGCTDF